MPIARRLVAAFAVLSVLSVLAYQPGHTAAASCSGNSHTLVLSAGAANPGSGTTATKFTFSVTYTDNDGCSPDRIVVIVTGVATYGLGYVKGTLRSGATFARTVTLPAGRWAYRFEASSGSGPGKRDAKLANVDPAKVIVAAVKADPTVAPVVTPAPTPRPTAAPTKPPATPRPSRSPAATHDTATPVPSPTAAPPTATPAASVAAAASVAGARPRDPAAPIAIVKLVVSSIGTIGGLVLFAVLSRRLLRPAPGVWPGPLPARRRGDARAESEAPS